MDSSSTNSRFIESLDSKYKSAVDRVQESRKDNSDDEDEDALFAELEAEVENADSAVLRDRGVKEMQAQFNKVQTMQQTGYGQYTEITDEKEVIRTSANEPRCVIHFFHRDFKRCEIMDKHLAALAPKYFSTLFIRVFVENVPWLVQKLGVRVLPCVMCFVNGVSTDQIIGFEALGNTDAFQTATLELRLKQNGTLTAPPKPSTSQTYTTATTRTQTRLRGRGGDGDDSDLDL